jgi:hypothetical protein
MSVCRAQYLNVFWRPEEAVSSDRTQLVTPFNLSQLLFNATQRLVINSAVLLKYTILKVEKHLLVRGAEYIGHPSCRTLGWAEHAQRGGGGQVRNGGLGKSKLRRDKESYYESEGLWLWE